MELIRIGNVAARQCPVAVDDRHLVRGGMLTRVSEEIARIPFRPVVLGDDPHVVQRCDVEGIQFDGQGKQPGGGS